MKANEFSANRKPTAKPKAAVPAVPVMEQASTIQEKKIVKKHKAAPASAAPVEGAYGIDDPNGPEVRRLRERHPEIWKKIKNWD